MGLETISLIATTVSGAVSAAGSLGLLGGSSPQAPDPVTPDTRESEVETAQRTAADRERRRAAAAIAQQTSVLTSPTGLPAKSRVKLGG